MSKRHQSHRRKSYGRRQHELQERRQREHAQPYDAAFLGDRGPTGLVDRLSFLDPRTPRLRYALGD